MKAEPLARFLVIALLAAVGTLAILAGTSGLPLGVFADVQALHARMPENGGWSLETLQAETGKPLRLRLTSDDVLHSFAIGQISGGELGADLPVDLHPGKWQEIALTFTKPGRYTYYCTRWCGRNHWRMRGTIIVTGADLSGTADNEAPAQPPRYLRLGINLDAPHQAGDIPAALPSSERGAALADRLPAWALERETYLDNSPAALWQRLREDASLQNLEDAALWDAVAYLWSRQTSPSALSEARQLYATNCAACHGETGNGDGPMVAGLPVFDPSMTHTGSEHPANAPHPGTPQPSGAGQMASTDMGLSAPPDLSDPRVLLGASPALYEGKLLRGGMGTGMPSWGPIFTQEQMDALVAYLYSFAFAH